MLFDWVMRIFMIMMIFTAGALFGVMLMALMEAGRK